MIAESLRASGIGGITLRKYKILIKKYTTAIKPKVLRLVSLHVSATRHAKSFKKSKIKAKAINPERIKTVGPNLPNITGKYNIQNENRTKKKIPKRKENFSYRFLNISLPIKRPTR